jgi:hypothetical protein
MPNAKTVPTPSSNNQNNVIPSEPSIIPVDVWRTGDLLHRDCTYRNLTHDNIMDLFRKQIPNELRLREQLANQRDPNPIDENDDIDIDFLDLINEVEMIFDY